MTSALRGGKTSPRLYEDMRVYNPQRLPQSQFNILTSLPVPFDGQTLPRTRAKTACVHDWRLKERQSWPAHAAQLAAGQVSRVAGVCARCRCHLRLSLNVPDRGQRPRPCPQLDAPLHHFMYDFTGSEGFVWVRKEGQAEAWRASEKFRCSLEACQAELVVEVYPPRLKREFVDLLTDSNMITSRAQDVIANDPTRFEGVAIPPVSQVLATLKAYLQNAVKSKGDAQRINAANKRWMLSLGEPCAELLKYLGFEDTQDGFWSPPKPEQDTSVPLADEFNIFLDDVVKELDALINLQDGQERLQRSESVMASATNELRRVLGCLDYETNPGTRAHDPVEEDEHPFYAGLGGVINFHDDLLSFAYDRQQLTDPSSSPYYLQCLQGIAKGRGSESLQTKAAIEESSGRVSLDDIKSAYSALGFDVSVPVDESTVIGTFQARITDAPRQEAELRRCLKVIGQHMGSRKIEDYAAESIDTYEQALAWLGATAEMGDDFITSMFSLKVNENPTNIEKARHCVRVIAGKRKSEALLGFLDTGILQETEMDPNAAYELLVPGNPHSDDDLILSHYTAALSDTPGQKHELDKALRAIAKVRNSPLLLNMSGGPDAASAYSHKLSEWPIGLENIGNTCYLNSLLQFFFTVKPLRSLVMSNEEYVMDIQSATINKKKVGGRQVTKREIERAQQFIKELSVLFQEMIVTPKSQITPKLELARLTMLSTFAEEGLRRQSVLSDSKPNLTTTGLDATQGHLSPPDDIVLVESPLAEAHARDVQAQSTKTIILDGDDTSEGTLVEAPATEAMAIDTQESVVPIYEDKENVSPTKDAFERPVTPDQTLKPLAETSPSRVNQESREATEVDAAIKQEPKHASTLSNASAAPMRPPPIPPREKAERRTTINEEELYRQQDVTEVIGNVLFQLQCAIKPDEIDSSGEQIDLIKKLFYGKMKTTTTDAAGKPRTMEEFFSDLKINVSSNPPDLYTALDSLFDRRMVELGSSEQAREEAQFSTVTVLPDVLQIHPIRTAFDRQRGAYKVNHQFVFDEVIYLDRYMDGGDPQTQQKRAKCWEMKDQLKRIEDRHVTLGKNELGLSARETLLLTADYIRQIDELSGSDLVPETSPTLAEKVKQAADDVKSELAALSYEEEQLRTTLQAAWSDATFRTIPYRLHAVFIHRGMVSSGHYWVYIFDHPHGIWRKYNDGYVTQVDDPATEIFGKQPGDRPATPMFFIYVKESRASELVEVLRRDLPEEEPTAAADNQAPEIKRAATEGVALGKDANEGKGPPGHTSTWQFAPLHSGALLHPRSAVASLVVASLDGAWGPWALPTADRRRSRSEIAAAVKEHLPHKHRRWRSADIVTESKSRLPPLLPSSSLPHQRRHTGPENSRREHTKAAVAMAPELQQPRLHRKPSQLLADVSAKMKRRKEELRKGKQEELRGERQNELCEDRQDGLEALSSDEAWIVIDSAQWAFKARAELAERM